MTKKRFAGVSLKAHTYTPTRRIFQYLMLGGTYPDGTFPGDPAKIDWSLCTDLILHNLGCDGSGNVTANLGVNGQTGTSWGQQLITDGHARGKQVHLGISGDMLPAMRDAPQVFADNLIRLADQLGADGIFLDWEPGAAALDANLGTYVAFAAKLRNRSHKIAVCTGEFNQPFPQWTPTAAYWAGFDWFFLMSYDMSWQFGGQDCWHNSPLYGEGGNRPMSVSYDVRHCLDNGVRRDQIIVGIGSYAMAATGAYAPGPAPGWSKVGVADDWGYDVMQANLSKFATRGWDETARCAWASNPTPVTINGKSITYLSWTDQRGLDEVAAFVQGVGVLGIGCWAMWYSKTYNEMIRDAMARVGARHTMPAIGAPAIDGNGKWALPAHYGLQGWSVDGVIAASGTVARQAGQTVTAVTRPGIDLPTASWDAN